MPNKIEDVRMIKWRIAQNDLELLEAIHGPGRVNSAARAIIAAHCERLRAELRTKGLLPSGAA